MSSETLQTIATLATLAVVAIGVTFAALQVRQEALARRLQAISALFDVVWPEEARRAAFLLLSLPADFEDTDITPEQKRAILTLLAHYDRVGFLLQTGLVKEHELLGFQAFGIVAADLWALLEGYLGRLQLGTAMPTNFRNNAVHWEYLAIRAKAYWERHGRAWTASVPYYDGKAGALMSDLNAAVALRPAR